MTTYCILWALFRTTLVLTICGGVCFLALRKIEHRLPKLSRLLWAAVLLTGWFWLQPVIEIPTPYLAGTPATHYPPLPLGEGRGEGFSYLSHVPSSPHPNPRGRGDGGCGRTAVARHSLAGGNPDDRVL